MGLQKRGIYDILSIHPLPRQWNSKKDKLATNASPFITRLLEKAQRPTEYAEKEQRQHDKHDNPLILHDFIIELIRQNKP